MKLVKIAYRPVGMVLGALSGALASAVFREAWQALRHEDDAPEATAQNRAWSEILLAAALQGAIFAVTKAAVDRGGATAVARLTGTWPR